MRFDRGVQSLIFEAGGDYPATRSSRVLQVRDRTAGGTAQVETLGVTVSTRVIVFNDMSLTDYEGLLDWFINVSIGGANRFDFTDEYGDVYDAVFAMDEINFKETSLGLYAGSITLEYV